MALYNTRTKHSVKLSFVAKRAWRLPWKRSLHPEWIRVGICSVQRKWQLSLDARQIVGEVRNSSQTRVSGFRFRADVARDFTAPMECAVTSFPRGVRHRPIAAIAAHQVTTVDADGCRVTLTPPGALQADRIVSLAIVRRILVVNEISQTWRFVVAINGDEIEPPRPFSPLGLVHRIA